MEVVIRKPGKDLVRFLLDKAMEEGMDLKVVRLIPDGLFIPVELALAAGLLDALTTPTSEESNDGATGRDAEPPKRATRKRAGAKSSTQAEAPAPEEVTFTEDPWL